MKINFYRSDFAAQSQYRIMIPAKYLKRQQLADINIETSIEQYSVNFADVIVMARQSEERILKIYKSYNY